MLTAPTTDYPWVLWGLWGFSAEPWNSARLIKAPHTLFCFNFIRLDTHHKEKERPVWAHQTIRWERVECYTETNSFSITSSKKSLSKNIPPCTVGQAARGLFYCSNFQGTFLRWCWKSKGLVNNPILLFPLREAQCTLILSETLYIFI